MPQFARKDIVIEGEVGIYHCITRCVRRALLCGDDPLTGRDFSHRKGWIRDRLKLLLNSFAIELCSYAVLPNHVHLVVRTRPDLVATWSDEEVVRRWWRMFPGRRRRRDGSAPEPKQTEIDALLADTDTVEKKRGRLSNLSWLMRCLNEWVARRANKEDQCTGRFWEGRFKCQALVDDAAVLACSMYVDLNPVRAKLAETPEESEYTSVKDRIDGQQSRKRTERNKKPRGRRRKDTRPAAADDWLCPILSEAEIRASRERADDASETTPTSSRPDAHTITAATPSPSFLPMGVKDYLRLLDWTRPPHPRRQARRDPQPPRPHPRPPCPHRRHALGSDRPIRKILPPLRRSGRNRHRESRRSR